MKPRRLIRGLSISAGALLVALIAAEIVLRRFPSTALGFEYQGGVFSHPREFGGEASLNSLGYHDVEPDPKQVGIERVLLLGDSYVAGLAVGVDETVGQRLEHHLCEISGRAFDVVAVGTPGWGQVQELEAIRAHVEALEADRVVVLFLPFNDVRNNSTSLSARAQAEQSQLDRQRPGWSFVKGEDAPLFLIEGSRLNQLVSHRLARRRDTEKGFIPLDYLVYRDPPDAEWLSAWSETARLLGEMRDAAAARGASFHLVSASTPHGVYGREQGLERLRASYPAMQEASWDLDLPDAKLKVIAQELDVPFLSLEPVFRESTGKGARLHWKYDGHWNAEGHDLAGREIAKVLCGRD